MLVLLRTQCQGGCASGESCAEEIPGSDLACGDLACGEVAGFSGNYSESGSNTIICLREEDVPGASLNGRDQPASCCGAEKMSKM